MTTQSRSQLLQWPLNDMRREGGHINPHISTVRSCSCVYVMTVTTRERRMAKLDDKTRPVIHKTIEITLSERPVLKTLTRL